MYKHIIWDFDGTLFDTYPMMANAFKTALEDEGIKENSEKIMSLLKISESYAIEYYRNKYGIGNELKAGYDKHKKEADIRYVRPFANVENICKAIYLSEKNNYLYTHRGESAITFLKSYQLYGYFSDFITKENNFKRKPEPEALLYLLNKHDIDVNEAIMIGDRDIDMLAAKNAGMKACFFDIDPSNKSEFADYTINDMRQLSGIIEVLPQYI